MLSFGLLLVVRKSQQKVDSACGFVNREQGKGHGSFKRARQQHTATGGEAHSWRHRGRPCENTRQQEPDPAHARARKVPPTETVREHRNELLDSLIDLLIVFRAGESPCRSV